MRIRPLAVLAIAAALVLSGCSTSVILDPAPDANNPACAAVTVRLPSTLNGNGGPLAQRETTAQATGAWGEPSAVILHCGVPVPSASSLPCIEVDGIQWLRDATNAPNFIFTSYGRDPAISVAVDSDAIGPGVALDLLSNVVSYTATNGRQCTSLQDTVTGSDLFPTDSPSPTPTSAG